MLPSDLVHGESYGGQNSKFQIIAVSSRGGVRSRITVQVEALCASLEDALYNPPN